ncbi:hypothetical protein N9X42_04790 [Candidatus Pelagibacter bacterium]|nr:hypothetical protein [Candidatus Pelagibacter bacterium]
MNIKNKIFRTLLYTHLLLLFSIKNGYAYLDPGTGNILIQIIAAVAASAAIYIGFVWHKIKLNTTLLGIGCS